MAGNSFGTLFRITTWGESHGTGVSEIVALGVPTGFGELVFDKLDAESARALTAQN